jgi:hypothetical protein
MTYAGQNGREFWIVTAALAALLIAGLVLFGKFIGVL